MKKERPSRFQEILNQEIDRDGNLIARHHINGKDVIYRVDLIIARRFVDNPNGYTKIRHIDDNKLNCKSENLEWYE